MRENRFDRLSQCYEKVIDELEPLPLLSYNIIYDDNSLIRYSCSLDKYIKLAADDSEKKLKIKN